MATPTLGFGEMIRQTLEGTGALSVGVASGTDSAKQQATNDPYAMAILDSDLGLSELKNLAQHLRQTSPSLHLLIIPPEEEGLQREIETLEPDGFLSKPFYLPDLLETVQTLLGIDPAAGALPAPENGRVAEVSSTTTRVACTTIMRCGLKSWRHMHRSTSIGTTAPARTMPMPT